MMECDIVTESPYDIILSTEQDRWLQAVANVKHLVIGSNRQKAAAISHGILPRLLEWMIDESVPQELRTESAVVLGSLAWGTSSEIELLVSAGAVPVLLQGISSPYLNHTEACLRCLRAVFMAPDPPVDYIYQDPAIILHLLSIISRTDTTKETVANILARSCTCIDHQNLLLEKGAVEALAPLLSETSSYKIQMPVLRCFAAICYKNRRVCLAVSQYMVNNVRVPLLISRQQSRDKTSDMQLAAAKCLTFLHRGGALEADSNIIMLQTLPTLVRMCKKDRTLEENVEGAETLAFLIEMSPALQYVTSICDHSLKALAEYLGYTDIQQLDTRQTQRKTVDWSSALKKAAFEAFAAVAANDEEIRKKVVAIDSLVESVVAGVNSDNPTVQVAASKCLCSLSRSVHLIRTVFQDHAIWKALVKLIQSHSTDVKAAAASTLCNLVLEFSPSKEAILECGTIGAFVEMVSQEDQNLRISGIWGLMNLSFNSDIAVKQQALLTLGNDRLMALLSDPDPQILLCILGFLRNLLSIKAQCEVFIKMQPYDKTVQQSVKSILSEDRFSIEVKEQALIVLAGMVQSNSPKYAMLHDDSFLRIVSGFLEKSCSPVLQKTASTVFLSLLGDDEVEKQERIRILKERGIWNSLQKFIQVPNRNQ